MSLFFVTFFLIYGGVHAYAFVKARQALGFGVATAVSLALFMAVMVLAPVLVRMAERYGLEATARFMAYTAYLWMGVLFLFFSAALAIDLYRLVIILCEKIFQRDLSSLALSNRAALFIPLGWGAATALYGFFEARDIRTERVAVVSSKVPRDMGKLTLVQISDVHLGLIVREGRLRNILEKVREADPDILISTGDLVDGQINEMRGLAELFQGVNPRYGKFAVTGNHEFYAGLGQALDFTERSGFRILRGDRVTVAGFLTIAGVDDPAIGWARASRNKSEDTVLAGLDPGKFTLFLKHRPAVEENSLGLFDLQLSGHVHKGQIFPFNLLTHLFYPVKSGFSIYPGNSSLYVSRGTGTWGPPIRFMAPPEVTVIDLMADGSR